jgi:hypothetical protein
MGIMRRLLRMEVDPKINEAEHEDQNPYVVSGQTQRNAESAEAERLPNAQPV